MKIVSRCLVIGLFVLTMVAVTHAETRYVSDTLVITLRELPDDTSTNIKTIVTDTPFDVLEQNGEFLKVRLESGEEGYVKARYTSKSIPKPVVIEKLQNENERLQQQYDKLTSNLSEKESSSLNRQKDLESTLGELKKENAGLISDKKQLEADLAKLDKEFTTLKNNADNVVQIVNQSEKFRADNERLLIEFESLQSENAILLRTGVIKWVLAGAGILFIGWIMGKASRNKRRY